MSPLQKTSKTKTCEKSFENFSTKYFNFFYYGRSHSVSGHICPQNDVVCADNRGRKFRFEKKSGKKSHSWKQRTEIARFLQEEYGTFKSLRIRGGKTFRSHTLITYF